MSSERPWWGWTLVVLFSLAGCRSLVETTEAPPDLGVIAGRFVDIAVGLPERVRIDSGPHSELRYISSVEVDDLGRFQAEAPPGTYDLYLRFPTLSPIPDFFVPAVEFGEEVVEVRFEAQPRRGRVIAPPGFPFSQLAGSDLTFSYVVEREITTFSVEQHLQAQLEPDGDFQVWLADADHSVQLRGFSGATSVQYVFEWSEMFDLDSPEPIELMLSLVEVSLDLTVGNGQPLPPGSNVLLSSVGMDRSVNLPINGEESTLAVWAFAGATEISISPDSGETHFMTKRILSDLGPGTALAANLGRREVTIAVVDENAVPWAGVGVGVEDELRSLSTRTGPDGTVRLYLDDGTYSVDAITRFRRGGELITVVADATVTVVLQ